MESIIEDLEIIEEKFIAMSEKYKTRPALKDKTWAISLVSLEEIHMNEKKSGDFERDSTNLVYTVPPITVQTPASFNFFARVRPGIIC